VSRDFARFWAAESISLCGSQVSALAIPLLAAVTLDATALQMGFLQASGFAPTLLVGLLAGVWVDRGRRRGLLIAADLGRGLLLLTIPAATLLGALRIEQLYVVEFLVGIQSTLFDVAYTAFVPSLVPAEDLSRANSKLELSQWTARVGGPGLAGSLIQLIGGPLAVAADAASFLLSAVLLAGIRSHEQAPVTRASDLHVVREVVEGARVVLSHPVQRALLACAATYNLFGYMQASVLVLYVMRDLALSPAVFGASLAIFGAGGLAGAFAAIGVADRLGVGRAIIGGATLAAIGDTLVALAGPPLPPVAVLLAGRFLAGAGLPLFVINAVSLRQTLTPAPLLGRASATVRWVTWGVLPIGALLGGLMGESLGLRGTLLAAAAGSALAVVWVVRSPLQELAVPPWQADHSEAPGIAAVA
jgi:MFS family permease